MNNITIIGNLTTDVRYSEPVTQGVQTPVASFGLASNMGRGDNQITDYFTVSVWRQPAINCRDYLAKGRKVAVTGSVHLRSYVPSQGANAGKTVYYMEIRANNVEFVSPPPTPAAAPAAATPAATAPVANAAPVAAQAPAAVMMGPDDLPF